MNRILPALRRAPLLAVVLGGVSIVALLAIVAASGSSGKDGASATVPVQRGNVVSTVSADGNVEPPRELSLGFEASGRLISVPVEEGDHVAPGQVLARLDDRSQRAQLGSAEANLESARARLAQTRGGMTPIELAERQRMADQSRVAVRNAERDLADARRIGRSNVAGLHGALARARVSGEQADLRAAQLRLAQDRSRLNALQREYLANRNQRQQDQEQLRAALDRLRDAQKQVPPDTFQINDANFRIAVLQDRIATEQSDEANAKADLDTATANVRTDVSDVEGDRVSLREATRRLGDAAGNLSNGIATAQQQLDSARASLTGSEAELRTTLARNSVDAQIKFADVAVGMATVAQAQSTLQDARKAVEDTVLRAPVEGVVGHVDAKVGQLVGAAGPSAAAAAAAMPQSGGAAGSAPSAGQNAPTPGAGAAGAGTGQSGLITLAQTRGLQVKANFNETDAASLHRGDAASITVDALPDKRFGAHVASIDPIARIVNNVVTYEVTLVLDEDQGQLKPGMTATANVTVARANQVLTVPRTAVRSPEGANPTVTVIGPDGKPQARLVVTGLQNDSTVQILGGVGLGERVVRTIAAPPDLSG